MGDDRGQVDLNRVGLCDNRGQVDLNRVGLCDIELAIQLPLYHGRGCGCLSANLKMLEYTVLDSRGKPRKHEETALIQ